MTTHDLRHPVRIAPLPRDEWSDAAAAAVEALPDEMRPPPGTTINVLSVLAHHGELMHEILQFSDYLRFRATIDDRQRELAIIRTALHRDAEYELLRHARNARRYGFTEEELIAISTGPDASCWSPAEAVLLRAVDELCRDYHVGDETWRELEQRYSRQQIMDLLFTVGTYDMFAMAYGSMGIQPEDDLDPYPVAPASDD